MLGRGWWLEWVWVEGEDDLALAGKGFLIDEGYNIAELVAYAIPILGSLVVYRAMDCHGHQIGT